MQPREPAVSRSASKINHSSQLTLQGFETATFSWG